MAIVFRPDAVRHASRRLEGAVVLTSPLPLSICSAALILITAAALYALSGVTINDYATVSGRFVGDRPGLALFSVRNEDAVSISTGQRIAVTIAPASGSGLDLSGTVERDNRPASSPSVDGHRRVAPRPGYSAVYVRLDRPSMLAVNRAREALGRGPVTGHLIVGGRSILEWLTDAH